MEQITSRKNPLLVQIRKLTANRGFRRQCGQFLGDGGKLELFEKPDMQVSEDGPWIHLALGVQQVDEAYQLALRAGAVSVKPPMELPLDAHPYRITLRVAFVRGPSGEELEFFKQIVNRFV